MAQRSGFGVSWGIVFLALSFLASVAAAAPAAKPLCSRITPSCGNSCTNTPFELTKCWPTSHGPARADVVTHQANLLACQNGPYALCAFSGPPAGIFGGQPLPCVLGRGGLTADCTCQYYSSGKNFVAINAILNQGAYFGAVSQCGAEGKGCANAISESGAQATVCTYVNNQPLGNPATSFFPKSDVQIISTFSQAMTPPYQLAKDPPTCHGKYAGCMTAACRFRDGKPPSSHKDGDAIQCECPVYDGDYQISASGQPCTLPSSDGKTYIWSASNTVAPTASGSKK